MKIKDYTKAATNGGGRLVVNRKVGARLRVEVRRQGGSYAAQAYDLRTGELARTVAGHALHTIAKSRAAIDSWVESLESGWADCPCCCARRSEWCVCVITEVDVTPRESVDVHMEWACSLHDARDSVTG